MTQKEEILRYMNEVGPITPALAMSVCGCMRLAARIDDLKKDGHWISVEMVSNTNRFGRVVRFARYTRMGWKGLGR